MAHILRITSKIAGFRRAGMAHAAAPTDHAIEKFTADQIEALKGEAMLTVEEVDLAAAPPPAAKAKAKK
ncbi:MAG: HI1506-related protein [Panacagrimonas sp.]